MASTRKSVTIVFCDLAGSTSLAERLDPEVLRQVVSSFFAAMTAALTRHGGIVEKFIGDAVMAVFGIPRLREDDALRAVRAAAEMRKALGELNDGLSERWGVTLEMRIGVNTGEVIAGDPTEGQRFATGDAVNVAARLEQAAAEGEVLMGETTMRLVSGEARVEPFGELKLKGKADPVEAYRLLGVSNGVVGRVPAGDLPLVGRSEALAALEAELADRTGPAMRVVSVSGPAGIGKTRLVDEFVLRCGADVLLARGRCASYGEGMTYKPLSDLVRQVALTDEADSAWETGSKLQEVVAAAGESMADAGSLASSIGELIGAADGSASVDPLGTVRRFLELAGGGRAPLVVVIEDAHLAEPAFREVLIGLAADPPRRPGILVVVGREGASLEGGVQVELEPLGDDEADALLNELAGGGAEWFDWSEVRAVAQGNPLFLRELARMIRETPGDRSHSVPATVEAVLAVRLEQLGAEEREVLECVAVIAEPVTPTLLADLLGSPLDEVATSIASLSERGILRASEARREGEPTVELAQLLIGDVAYGLMLKGRRAELHARYAGWLERSLGSRLGERQEAVGHHLQRAHRFLAELGPLDEEGEAIRAQAAAHLGEAGSRALARGDARAASVLLQRTKGLLSEEDPLRREVDLRLAVALADVGELTRAGEVLAEGPAARGRTLLRYEDAAGAERELRLDPRVVASVGRRSDRELALTWDTQVSREHARIEAAGGRWHLVDTGSRNGSFVNGEPVEGRRTLADGDLLLFGDTEVRFECRDPAPGD